MIQGNFKLSVMGSGFSRGFTDVCACDAVKSNCGCSGGGDAFSRVGGFGNMNRSMQGGARPGMGWGNGGGGIIDGGHVAECMKQAHLQCLNLPGCWAMYILFPAVYEMVWLAQCVRDYGGAEIDQNGAAIGN